MRNLLDKLACLILKHDEAFNLHRGYFCLQCGKDLN